MYDAWPDVNVVTGEASLVGTAVGVRTSLQTRNIGTKAKPKYEDVFYESKDRFEDAEGNVVQTKIKKDKADFLSRLKLKKTQEEVIGENGDVIKKEIWDFDKSIPSNILRNIKDTTIPAAIAQTGKAVTNQIISRYIQSGKAPESLVKKSKINNVFNQVIAGKSYSVASKGMAALLKAHINRITKPITPEVWKQILAKPQFAELKDLEDIVIGMIGKAKTDFSKLSRVEQSEYDIIKDMPAKDLKLLQAKNMNEV